MPILIYDGEEYDTEEAIELNISGSSVREISDQFKQLEALDCSETRYLKNIPSTLTTLIILDCSRSSLKMIPAEFVNLEEIHCSYTDISIIPDTFIHLSYLDCDNTKVREIPDTLMSLEELRCNNTEVREIPSTLTSLEQLQCNNTKVGEIPDTFTSLKYLRCDNTEVREIPSTLTSLRDLYCNNTQVREIPDTLTSLEDLLCKNTLIVELPDTLVKLSKLDCSNTAVVELPNTFVKLYFLTCNKTKIENIPNTYRNLKFLECNDTHIRCLPDNIINSINTELPACNEYFENESEESEEESEDESEEDESKEAHVESKEDESDKDKGYKNIKKVSKDKDVTMIMHNVQEELLYKNSLGCYTEKKGVVCNLVDMEDVEHKEFLSQDEDNIIFLISPDHTNKYYAYGYNRKYLGYDINTDVYYDCKRKENGTYETSVDGNQARFDKNGKAYIKLNLSFPVLVLAEELLGCLKNGRVFLLKDPKKEFLYTASYGVLFSDNPSYVSADHCQKGSNKTVYTLYLLGRNYTF